MEQHGANSARIVASRIHSHFERTRHRVPSVDTPSLDRLEVLVVLEVRELVKHVVALHATLAAVPLYEAKLRAEWKERAAQYESEIRAYRAQVEAALTAAADLRRHINRSTQAMATETIELRRRWESEWAAHHASEMQRVLDEAAARERDSLLRSRDTTQAALADLRRRLEHQKNAALELQAAELRRHHRAQLDRLSTTLIDISI
ncbi:hypothetical protein SPRG_07531 [Saprolegnia parasitica CBS 223.65]|uniref:Uncharacterized protein n=1 Tax=Saprolegnia parasitica (strain CBS 223.65) TaxID=695850 RepID=A0A067CKG9_SAPPC|nr:hypothetical protein SPRG_07531 [Saprolegnia parasitica CBS 223.65]KDO27282.1 hypothetical protein SPRG_07531 [Saprolegnia parasitica CBS 223.65]|eukprot:XP_012202057.1 hypothetical protein SPRG_07531 [Saprolegnia parasitica CBS 223.65]